MRLKHKNKSVGLRFRFAFLKMF